jgi:hypothetical protein
MAKNTSLTKTYDQLPLVLRIIIQLLGGAVVGGIYRIVRYLETKNLITLVVGLLATFTGVGNLIAWIVDLVTLVLHGKYTYFVD